ncbi:MAG: ATP-binding protein [Promethearchaeota archaeon]
MVIQRKITGEFHCPACFTESIENVIYQTVIHYRMLKPEDRIIVGLSGGKDSISLLYNMTKIKEKIRNTEPIIALTIDEGIRDYRKSSIEDAKQFCQKHNIEHVIISFKERIGENLDEILLLKRGTDTERYTCNYCATIRRRLLNEGAKNLGGTVLVLGHNLTDVTETFLMNILHKRHQLIANQYLFKTENTKTKKHFIKKINPLIKIPEEEKKLIH